MPYVRSANTTAGLDGKKSHKFASGTKRVCLAFEMIRTTSNLYETHSSNGPVGIEPNRTITPSNAGFESLNCGQAANLTDFSFAFSKD
jgi:hypothetical protein